MKKKDRKLKKKKKSKSSPRMIEEVKSKELSLLKKTKELKKNMELWDFD